MYTKYLLYKIHMKYGKYRSYAIEDIPSSYLEWMLENINDCIRLENAMNDGLKYHDENYKIAVEKELDYRDRVNGHIYE